MADFTKNKGGSDPLPIKYADQGDGTVAEVVALAGAGVSVSVAGFTPNGNVASLTLGAASANVALPAGTVVLVTNTGTVTAFLKLSVGAGTAAATDMALVAGASVGLTVGSNTYINGITAGSAGAIRIAGGSGLVGGYGGGGSSGGGGGDASAANQTAVIGTKAPGTAAASSLLAGAVYTSGGITLTNGQQAALQMDSSGRLLTSSTSDATAANQTSVIGTKAAGTAAASALLTGGVYNSTPPTVTNGQQVALQLSAAGRLLVDASITGGGDATAANQTVVQGVIGAATAPTKMNAVGGVYNSTPLTLTNGQSSALQLDANGYLNVNIKTGASSGAVSQGSTTSGQTGLLMQGAVTTGQPSYTTAQTSPLSLTTAGLLRVAVESQSGVAQGSTTSGQTGSPILARTLSTSPTDTTAQSNMPVLDLKGALLVQPYGHNDNGVSGVTAAMTGTTSTSLIPAPGSGLYNYITTIIVSNSHATIGTDVELQDGSGGTTFAVIPAAALYGGAAITLPKPLKQPTSNTALYVKNTTTGASTRVTAIGYKGP